MRRYHSALLAVVALNGLAVTGCRGGGLPSRDQEIELGRKFAQEYETKLPDGPLVTNGPTYDRLQRIAGRVLPLARRDWDVPYNVKVVQSDQVNAFAVPGGPIYFYTGLINLAASDDEIASVMGHEISHVTKRHSVKQMKKSQDTNLLLALGDALLKGNNTIKSAASVIAGYKSLEYSRGDESQADRFGFDYLVKAGYRPEAMADFFTRMQEKTGGSRVPEFLSSHPVTSSRISDARKRAQDYRKGTYKAP